MGYGPTKKTKQGGGSGGKSATVSGGLKGSKKSPTYSGAMK